MGCGRWKPGAAHLVDGDPQDLVDLGRGPGADAAFGGLGHARDLERVEAHQQGLEKVPGRTCGAASRSPTSQGVPVEGPFHSDRGDP